MPCSEDTEDDDDDDLLEKDAVTPIKITRTPEQEMEDFVARGQVGWDADSLLSFAVCTHLICHKGDSGFIHMCLCAPGALPGLARVFFEGPFRRLCYDYDYYY